MIITLPSLPLRACSYRLVHIALKISSPLNHLDFHLPSFPTLTHRKTELHSMSHSLTDHPFLLPSLLQLPIRCMSAIGASPRIYLGSPIGYSLRLIGYVQTNASGAVALGWLRKNLVFPLRRLSRRHLRARKVCHKEMRYDFLNSSCITSSDGRLKPINFLSLLHPSSSPPYYLFVSRIIKSSDQQASIFLQQKLKIADSSERAKIIDAICARGFEMMAHRYIHPSHIELCA
jgi:hypothetical protein